MDKFNQYLLESSSQDRFKTAQDIEDFLSDNAANAIDYEDNLDIFTALPKKPFGVSNNNVKPKRGKYDSLELHSKTSKDKYLVEFPKYNMIHIFKWVDKKWSPWFESYIDELF